MAKATLEIRSLARAHTETAIRVLKDVMNAKKAPHSARVAAATALLDRGWGKPNQPLEHDVTNEVADLLRAIDGKTRALPLMIGAPE